MLSTYASFSEIEATSSSPRIRFLSARRGEPRIAQGGSPGERPFFMTIAPQRGAAKLPALVIDCACGETRNFPPHGPKCQSWQEKAPSGLAEGFRYSPRICLAVS
jgi:hypothetical protein